MRLTPPALDEADLPDEMSSPPDPAAASPDMSETAPDAAEVSPTPEDAKSPPLAPLCEAPVTKFIVPLLADAVAPVCTETLPLVPLTEPPEETNT
jgi:hypothetical protein